MKRRTFLQIVGSLPIIGFVRAVRATAQQQLLAIGASAATTYYQRQVPGAPYINESGTFQAQVPGGAYMNEGGA